MSATSIFLVLLICGSTGSEFAIVRGVKAVREPSSLRPVALVRFLGRAIRTGWLMLGIALLLLLSWNPFVHTAGGSQQLSVSRGSCWVGVALVAGG